MPPQQHDHGRSAVPRGYGHGGEVHRGRPLASSAAAAPDSPPTPPLGRGRRNVPCSRPRGQVRDDISCGSPVPPCPRRHDRGRPVASRPRRWPSAPSRPPYAATSGEATSSAAIPWPRLRRQAPLPPFPPSPPALVYSNTPQPPDHFLCGRVHLSRPRRRCPPRPSRSLLRSDGPRSSSPRGASSAATSPTVTGHGRPRGHVHGSDILWAVL